MAHTEASAQETTQQQQQQQQQEHRRPKERKDSPPKRARTETQESQVEASEADAADDADPRSPGQMHPAVTEKKVFFERYTDSPEFSRVKNPVVHARNRTGLEDVIDPNSKLANYQSPMDRRKRDPMDLRRIAVFGAQKLANADTSTKNQQKSKAEKADTSFDSSISAEDVENMLDDDDDDDEGPEDDTFEFLL